MQDISWLTWKPKILCSNFDRCYDGFKVLYVGGLQVGQVVGEWCEAECNWKSWRWAMMGLVFYHKNTSGCLLGAGCAGSAGCYLAWCPMSIAVCALYEWQVTTRHLSVPDRSKLRTLCTFLAPYGSNRLKLNLRFKVSQWEKYPKNEEWRRRLTTKSVFFCTSNFTHEKNLMGEVAHYFLEKWRGADDADRDARYQRLHMLYAPEARKVVEEPPWFHVDWRLCVLEVLVDLYDLSCCTEVIGYK